MTDELALPRHGDGDSKHDRGTALVVGGGRETPGAVLLAGLAALRVGAGKLQLATVASLAPTIAVHVPEARVVGLPETSGGELHRDSGEIVGALAKRADAVLVGPGVLDDAGMDDVVAAALASGCRTIVLDAGALPALARAGRAGPQVIA